MKLPDAHQFLPHLLGTYELELHDTILELSQTPFARHIHVGAAQGFYAVGLARLQPHAKVTAFEENEATGAVLKSAAEANDVIDRFDLRGRCEQKELLAAIDQADGPTFLLVDIEGGELALLSAELVAQLKGFTILVETHDLFVDGCSATLQRRFAGAFHVIVRTSRNRTYYDFPKALAQRFWWIPRSIRAELLKERTSSHQEWLVCVPRR